MVTCTNESKSQICSYLFQKPPEVKETQKREKLEDVKEIVKPPLDEEFKGVKEILVGRKLSRSS